MSTPGTVAIYRKEEIYDPDTNHDTNGITPNIGDIIIDNGILTQVISINDVTKKIETTVAKASYVGIESSSSGNVPVSIIDYGNTRFYLFYDNSTYPIKIDIDKKLTIFGNSAKYMRVIKLDQYNNKIVLSDNYSVTGDNLSEYIPLMIADENSYLRTCPTIYSDTQMNEDEIVVLEIYDENHYLLSSVNLFCRSSKNIELSTTPYVITSLELNATQEIDDNTFYLYPNQSNELLYLSPKLKYNDGSTKLVAIDEQQCFIYGLDDFQASHPGQTTKILCKYFLSEFDTVDPNLTENNIIAIEKTIKVLKDTSDSYTVKVSMIPRYDATNNKYDLYFYLYILGSNNVYDVTTLIELEDFDGREYDNYQSIKSKLNLSSILPVENELHLQNWELKLSPVGYYDKYIIRDNLNDDYGIYGVEGGEYRRPVLHKQDTSFFVNNNIFVNKDYFLEMFYYKARPLYDTSDSTIEPTHFTIRNVLTNTLMLSDPISVNAYDSSFILTDSLFMDSVVIVEFLNKSDDDDTFDVIYGVPVDIV